MNNHVLRRQMICLVAVIAAFTPGLVSPLTAQESLPAVSEVDESDAPETGTDLDLSLSDAPPPDTASMLGRVVTSLTIFVLAIFVGFEVITKVPPTLHTPLMSGSNAISGITLVGAVLMAGFSGDGWGSVFAAVLGMMAVVLATINVVGGFMVTDRMLSMFKKK